MHCSDIFFEARTFCRARVRNNPRFLGKQPGQCDLSGCCPLAFRDLANQIYQCLIRFARFGCKSWEFVAEVGTVKCSVLVQFSCEEASTQWAEGHEADPELLKHWQYFHFRTSGPQRVFALQSSDWLNGMCTADRCRAGFRESAVFCLALPDQVLHRS